MNVEIYIDELVLNGFFNSNRNVIGDTIKSELVRLVKEKGSLSSMTKGRETPFIHGGQFETKNGANARVIGTHVAEIVFGKINLMNTQFQGQEKPVPLSESSFQATRQNLDTDVV